jgi:hypothetical protein
MAETIEVDYLVIGAGAMGLAFVDTLISDTKATVAIVDRYDRPGGHWTTSYPYVRLHQPSAYYGVNSRKLGNDMIDKVGWNEGLVELATGDEVLAYYATVMQQTFLPSGRVKYFPKHEYMAEGEWRSLVTGNAFRVGEGATIVDATYMKVVVPSMGKPQYQVTPDVDIVTPNQLPKVTRPYRGYTVVGSGKTGIDACLWLLAQGIDPKHMTWIMPRDPWFLKREWLQPLPEFFPQCVASSQAVNEAIERASSPEDLFQSLESGAGPLMRMTEEVWPTTFHCATITKKELDAIREIGRIVRQGRVVSISAKEVEMESGSYMATPDTLYIDCSANGTAKRDPVPVFNDKHITLQPVRFCQQVFSAALIAHVEATYQDEKLKNDLCRPIPHPDEAIDWLVVNLQTQVNALAWAAQPKTAAWISQARLDIFRAFMPPVPEDPKVAAAFGAAMKAQLDARNAKLRQLIDQLPEKDAVRARAQIEGF